MSRHQDEAEDFQSCAAAAEGKDGVSSTWQEMRGSPIRLLSHAKSPRDMGRRRKSTSLLQTELRMQKELEARPFTTGLGTTMAEPVWPGS